MPSSHLILCRPLLLLPPIPPSSVAYHFAFSSCSWGSQGENTEVVCHSLLQWTTFCQRGGLNLVRLASLSEEGHRYTWGRPPCEDSEHNVMTEADVRVMLLQTQESKGPSDSWKLGEGPGPGFPLRPQREPAPTSPRPRPRPLGLGERNIPPSSCSPLEPSPAHWWGLPGGTRGKEPTRQFRRCTRCKIDPWVRKIPWRRARQPTPVFLPGESHGQRSLAGCSPQGRRELDTTEATEQTYTDAVTVGVWTTALVWGWGLRATSEGGDL